MIKNKATKTRNKWKKIAMGKAWLTREIHDLDIKYVKIVCSRSWGHDNSIEKEIDYK